MGEQSNSQLSFESERARSQGPWRRIAAGTSIYLRRAFLPPDLASELLKQLYHQISWRQDTIHMFGKAYPVPRLHQWFGDPDAVYSWSGLTMQPQPWSPELAYLRGAVEAATRRRFNSVLVNFYRDGSDAVSWHADDEPELGSQPLIASVSLGASRDFILRRKHDVASKISVSLENGSLLVMAGTTQQEWEHALPRRKRVKQPRLNLTFRQIKAPAEDLGSASGRPR